MSSRLALVLTSLLVASVLLAACGDDEGADPATTGAETSTQESTTEESGGGSPEATQQALEQCRSSFESQPQLSDELKSELEEICVKAAEGDEDAVREAAEGACEKIVEETAPAGIARDTALEACKQASQAR